MRGLLFLLTNQNVPRPNAQFQNGPKASPHKYLMLSIFLQYNVHKWKSFYFCEPVKNVPRPNAQFQNGHKSQHTYLTGLGTFWLVHKNKKPLICAHYIIEKLTISNINVD